MTSLLETAASLHAAHLKLAEQALHADIPDLPVFYLHASICNAVNKTLKAYEFPGLKDSHSSSPDGPSTVIPFAPSRSVTA